MGINTLRVCGPGRLVLISVAVMMGLVWAPVSRGQPAPAMGARLGQGTFVSPNFVLNLDVQIRTADGTPLRAMAVVTLYSQSGLPISTATAKESKALFTQLAPGQYYVEVEAPGYWKTREDTIVDGAVSDNIVKVLVLPAAAGSAPAVYYHTPLLAPEVQKELEKGMAALKSGKIEAAQKSLKFVLKKAPNHPIALYATGLAAEKRGNAAEARQYWEKSLSFDPTQQTTVYALGQSYLSENNYAKAEQLGNRLLQLDANSWKAHSLLASAAFRQARYSEAVAHAERSIEVGGTAAGSISVVLAQALAVQGRKAEAVEALKRYLASKPEGKPAEIAQTLLTQIESNADRYVISGTNLERAASSVPQPELTLLAERWVPANIDEVIPPVEPGATCDLNDVLQKAGHQLELLPHVLDRFSANERLEHQDVSENGIASKATTVSFAYVVSIHETRPGFLNTEEYRNGTDEASVFPEHLATRGLPSQVFVFHPYYQHDFDLRCEGLARQGSGFAWQVRFEQKPDVPSRMQVHYLNGKRYPVPLKGRAWIDASSYDVLHLESDLREPLKAIGLYAQHTDIEYGPVRFKKDNVDLWLPIRAEIYLQTRGHRIHRRHDFSDYLLFAIDDKQTIGMPKQNPPQP